MKRSIKSTDPRKPVIMTQLKLISGANKVTTVIEISPGLFTGSCLSGNRYGYKNLGTFQIRIDFGADPETGSMVYQVLRGIDNYNEGQNHET